ncbi:MAG: hypothetical protein ACRDJN_11575, partial [Chloroflexota bacterium]
MQIEQAEQAEAVIRTAAKSHPELAAEQQRLGATLAAIERAVSRPLRANTGAGDETAVLAMEALRAWRREQLREALQSPYFARIDFAPEGDDGAEGDGRAETYYLGKTYFAGDGVAITGWQAPVAALFYRATSADAAYMAPEGEIRGRLRLKRRLVVDHGALLHMADDLDERPPADRRGALVAVTSGEDLLRAVLSETASPWLRDMIATIQPQQYALIAAPADQVLVVQGVAGSGKTSIALHRLSYLVYPALAAGKPPPCCLVFGPNQLFLRYVSAVLPRLGLQQAVQTTVADWALARLDLEHLRVTDITFDALQDPDVPADQKDALSHRSRLKTSRRMGTLLERYVEWRRDRIDIPEDGWAVQQTVSRATGPRQIERRLPADALRARHARHTGRPFAAHRALFYESVLALLNERESDDTRTWEEAEAKRELGRKRLQQAADLRAGAHRGPAPREPEAVPFGAPPVFGASLGPLGGGRRAPGVTRVGGAPEALLRQTIRQLELAAERRQREGEELVREAEASLDAI